jgi:ribonuclease HI
LAEALALRKAVLFAKEEGFDSLIIASDCLSVVQRVNDLVTDRSDLGAVIEDIKLLASSFLSCSFTHVYRNANVAAHSLARCCENSSLVLRGVARIREFICNDIMVT